MYSVTDLFTLDKNEIKVSLNPGQVKTENVTITNPGTQPITITIENLIPDFVMRGEDVILLNPGESKVIPLYIIVKAETIPNLYLGKIIISSGSTKREILLAVEVESAGILLDVRAEILKRLQTNTSGRRSSYRNEIIQFRWLRRKEGRSYRVHNKGLRKP